jgi:dynein heavy chain
MSTSPLLHIHRSGQDVFTPVITNPRNQEFMSDIVSSQLSEAMHKTVSQIYVALGQSMGKTLLAVPPGEMLRSDGSSGKDKDRVHVLETSVVTWTMQIKNVLKTQPEAALAGGENPGPLVGLLFWEEKAANLSSIREQLSSDRIKKVLRVLELTKSPYHAAFHALIKEVDLACAEARDNVKYLRTLKTMFETVNGLDDFSRMPSLYHPIMHVLLLVWKNSKYYNTPAALAVLMRELCNDIIMKAHESIKPAELLSSDAAEAHERLVTALKVCGFFKKVYFDYKLRATKECPNNPWKIQNSALFVRLDAFNERCMDLLELTRTVMQFEKLERVDIGGNKGKQLTEIVADIYAEFQRALERMKGVTYDILDISVKQFDDDFYTFRATIKELEERLGGVINQGFDTAVTIQNSFKLLDSFADLLERDWIQASVERKHLDLVTQYGNELRAVQDIFQQNRNASLLGKVRARKGALQSVRRAGLLARCNRAARARPSLTPSVCLSAFSRALPPSRPLATSLRPPWLPARPLAPRSTTSATARRSTSTCRPSRAPSTGCAASSRASSCRLRTSRR